MATLYAWGAGEDGQLGLGDLKDQQLPQLVTSLQGLDIVKLVAGSRNSLALTASGDVYTWGWNQRGTLGHPEEARVESIPRQVSSLANVRIVQAAIGGWHCLAVDDGGRVYAWGGNEYGQCGEPVKKDIKGKILLRDISTPKPCATQLRVRQVSAGGTHSAVLTTSEEVWTWGQPWPPGDSTNIWVPVKVPGLSNVCKIAVGAFHNLALLPSGQVEAWGNNEYAQLGVGDTQPRALPETVHGLPDKGVIDVSAGGWHSMAITESGEVYGWGRGEHGRLGLSDDDKTSKMVPQKVELLSEHRIIQVECGGTHSLAVSDTGLIFSFGRGDHGRLGLGHKVTCGHPQEVRTSHLPIPEEEQQDPDASPMHWHADLVAAGGRHNFALLRRAPCPEVPRMHMVGNGNKEAGHGKAGTVLVSECANGHTPRAGSDPPSPSVSGDDENVAKGRGNSGGHERPNRSTSGGDVLKGATNVEGQRVDVKNSKAEGEHRSPVQQDGSEENSYSGKGGG